MLFGCIIVRLEVERPRVERIVLDVDEGRRDLKIDLIDRAHAFALSYLGQRSNIEHKIAFIARKESEVLGRGDTRTMSLVRRSIGKFGGELHRLAVRIATIQRRGTFARTVAAEEPTITLIVVVKILADKTVVHTRDREFFLRLTVKRTVRDADIEIEADQDGHHYTYQGDDHTKRNLLFP